MKHYLEVPQHVLEYLDNITKDFQARGFLATRKNTLDFLFFRGEQDLYYEMRCLDTEGQNEFLEHYFNYTNVLRRAS